MALARRAAPAGAVASPRRRPPPLALHRALGLSLWSLTAWVSTSACDGGASGVRTTTAEGGTNRHIDAAVDRVSNDARDAGARSPPDATAPPDTTTADGPAAAPSDAGHDGARDPGLDAADAAPLVSLRCGDAIRGPDEECDDGNADDADFCTSACTARDRPAAIGDAPAPVPLRRSIATGGHVAAAGRDGAALLMVDHAVTPDALLLALFRRDGTRAPSDSGVAVSGQTAPYDPTDASVAALPEDRYAVAWTSADVDGAGLGVVLRGVDGATGTLTDSVIVNSTTAGSQQHVDLVWTGTELVVAWTDGADPAHPHVRFRRYTASLEPLAEEQTLAPDRDNTAPALARHGNDWAAAWMERDANANPTYFVRAGSVEWTVGGFYNVAGDLPRLVAMDAEHFLLAVTAPVFQTDGGFDVPRLFGAVLATAFPGSVTPFPIEPLAANFAGDPTSPQRRPALAFANGSAFVSYFSGPGRGGGRRALLLRQLPWLAGSPGSPILDLGRAEIPLPHDAERQFANQDDVAVAATPWQGGALFGAWEDTGWTFGGSERQPDVVAELLPVPILRPNGDANRDP